MSILLTAFKRKMLKSFFSSCGSQYSKLLKLFPFTSNSESSSSASKVYHGFQVNTVDETYTKGGECAL